LPPEGELFGTGSNQPQNFPSIIAFENNDIRVGFSFQKAQNNNSVTLITATVSNKTVFQISEFGIQAAPPPHLRFIFGNFSKVIPGNGSIQVPIKAINNAQGDRPLLMKMRILYSSNGKSEVVEHVVRNFPQNL